MYQFSGEGLYVLLRITHTPKYPDEIPELEIEESDNMSDEDLDEFKAHLHSVMEESLGMVMIFTIISTSIEWLGSKWEEIKHRESEEIRLKKELSDAEEKVMTMDSFQTFAKTNFEKTINQKLIVGSVSYVSEI